MKKRIMALALAAVMSLSLSVTAFAAEKKSTDEGTASSTQNAASSEDDFDVTGDGLDDKVEISVEANNALITAVNNLKSSGVSILFDTTKNLTAPGTYTWALAVPDTAIGKAAIVYHYHDGAWTRQIVTVSAAKTITVTFKSASPVYIAVTDKTAGELKAQGVSNTEPGTTDADKNSPKTADNNLALLLALMACVSGGALIATKKSR